MDNYLFIVLAYITGSFVTYFAFRSFVIGETITALIETGIIRSKKTEDGGIEILKYDGSEIND